MWDKKVYIWREPISNHRFKATKEHIYRAELKVNNALQIDGEVSFDNFLLDLGIHEPKLSYFYWEETDGKVEIYFRMSRMEKGVIELEYNRYPKHTL